MDKWQADQRTFRRCAENRELSRGERVLYRLRFILAGDLADAWNDVGGITAKINHLAVALGISIADHAGVAAMYDYRIRRPIQKLAKNRPTRTDYYAFLRNINKEMRADVLRDIAARTGEMEKEKEKEKSTKAKATKDNKPTDKKKGKGRWNRNWTPEDCAGWGAKRGKTAPDTSHDDDKTEPAQKKNHQVFEVIRACYPGLYIVRVEQGRYKKWRHPDVISGRRGAIKTDADISPLQGVFR